MVAFAILNLPVLVYWYQRVQQINFQFVKHPPSFFVKGGGWSEVIDNGLTMANLIEQLTIGVQDYTTITKVG